jgi:hypothetical protein
MKKEINPKTLLINSSEKATHKGSSTCCIILLDPQSLFIETCYMGDSLYMICRYDESTNQFYSFFKSEEQVHSFNKPFQVGTKGDDPEKAICQKHTLTDKDILILASDG